MRLIGAAGLAIVCGTVALGAQQITTTITQKTTFAVTDGHDLTVRGCVRRFEDAGYMLTDGDGRMTYVLVTNDNLDRFVGHRVEISGLGSEGDDGTIEIEREVGTSGVVGGTKVDGPTLKQTREVSGDNIGFPYVSVKSVKKIASACR
jgi:hypothetical protein